MLPLPHAQLCRKWSSLLFDDACLTDLLREIKTVIRLSLLPELTQSLYQWSKLLLFEGPTGTGKSTTCMALAQTLSIDFKHCYSSLLLTMNPGNLLTKYFGESPKMIKDRFDSILSLAQREDYLLFVVIDEVDTIAISRDEDSDCGDAARV